MSKTPRTAPKKDDILAAVGGFPPGCSWPGVGTSVSYSPYTHAFASNAWHRMKTAIQAVRPIRLAEQQELARRKYENLSAHMREVKLLAMCNTIVLTVHHGVDFIFKQFYQDQLDHWFRFKLVETIEEEGTPEHRTFYTAVNLLGGVMETNTATYEDAQPSRRNNIRITSMFNFLDHFRDGFYLNTKNLSERNFVSNIQAVRVFSAKQGVGRDVCLRVGSVAVVLIEFDHQPAENTMVWITDLWDPVSPLGTCVAVGKGYWLMNREQYERLAGESDFEWEDNQVVASTWQVSFKAQNVQDAFPPPYLGIFKEPGDVFFNDILETKTLATMKVVPKQDDATPEDVGLYLLFCKRMFLSQNSCSDALVRRLIRQASTDAMLHLCQGGVRKNACNIELDIAREDVLMLPDSMLLRSAATDGVFQIVFETVQQVSELFGPMSQDAQAEAEGPHDFVLEKPARRRGGAPVFFHIYCDPPVVLYLQPSGTPFAILRCHAAKLRCGNIKWDTRAASGFSVA